MKARYGILLAAYLLASGAAMAQSDSPANMSEAERRQKIIAIQQDIRSVPPEQRPQVQQKMTESLQKQYNNATPEQQRQMTELLKAINDPKLNAGDNGR